MAYSEGQDPRWITMHGRQQSWDPSHSHLRPSNNRGRMPQRYKDTYNDVDAAVVGSLEDPNAFLAQYDEVERASDNLAKSTRILRMPTGRRDSIPPPAPFARQYPDFDSRLGAPPRHHSIGGEIDGMRSHSAHSSSSVQGYLAHQRYPTRMNEQEHLAKRRAAAQRERDLRNYHQEQQYNRNTQGAKSDRSASPSGMSEDDRRDLIARQHRALYGNESSLYMPDGSSTRPVTQDARVLTGTSGSHGPSPMNYEAYGTSAPNGPDATAQPSMMSGNHARSRSNSNSSPVTTQNAFAMYDSNSQSNIPTSSSSPGASPTRAGVKQAAGGGVAPIGTRPLHAKRSTPPVPSPLNHGYGRGGNDRSQSSASNPATSGGEKPPGLGWGGGHTGGPWGNKAQASVWG